MAKRPKLETVAKAAGVSTATASQAIRGTGRISDATRKKVMAAAHKLNYVPDARAAAMRSGQNHEIGFVINQITNPFNAEVISGVSDFLEDQGFLVSVLDARDNKDRQRRHIEAFIRTGRGGLLWVPALDTSSETLALLNTHRTPTVTFMRRPEAAQLDHVGLRNTEATRTATAHLADLGHRNIAYLGGTDMTDVRRDRIAGYRQVLSERGLCAPVIWNSADNKLDGLHSMMALRIAHPETTAVVCNGDTVALGACVALTSLGLTPGKEVSVIGFDDIQDAAVATPPLTTMAVSPHYIGRHLARVLLDRIREPESPATVSEISAKLVIRETTGPRPI